MQITGAQALAAPSLALQTLKDQNQKIKKIIQKPRIKNGFSMTHLARSGRENLKNCVPRAFFVRQGASFIRQRAFSMLFSASNVRRAPQMCANSVPTLSQQMYKYPEHQYNQAMQNEQKYTACDSERKIRISRKSCNAKGLRQK